MEGAHVDILLQNCVYTHCYCEENVWKLCEQLSGKVDLAHFYAVFISNPSKQIPLWCQKSGKSASDPVVWDYHVILILKRGDGAMVYDFDTTLGFPSSLKEYATKALRNEQHFNKNFHRFFRVVPSGYFLKTFASDRSHMLGKDGQWLQTPPSYPQIKTKDDTMNLFEFIDMTSENSHGLVMDLDTFLQHFGIDVKHLSSESMP